MGIKNENLWYVKSVYTVIWTRKISHVFSFQFDPTVCAAFRLSSISLHCYLLGPSDLPIKEADQPKLLCQPPDTPWTHCTTTPVQQNCRPHLHHNNIDSLCFVCDCLCSALLRSRQRHKVCTGPLRNIDSFLFQPFCCRLGAVHEIIVMLHDLVLALAVGLKASFLAVMGKFMGNNARCPGPEATNPKLWPLHHHAYSWHEVFVLVCRICFSSNVARCSMAKLLHLASKLFQKYCGSFIRDLTNPSRVAMFPLERFGLSYALAYSKFFILKLLTGHRLNQHNKCSQWKFIVLFVHTFEIHRCCLCTSALSKVKASISCWFFMDEATVL